DSRIKGPSRSIWTGKLILATSCSFWPPQGCEGHVATEHFTDPSGGPSNFLCHAHGPSRRFQYAIRKEVPILRRPGGEGRWEGGGTTLPVGRLEAKGPQNKGTRVGSLGRSRMLLALDMGETARGAPLAGPTPSRLVEVQQP